MKKALVLIAGIFMLGCNNNDATTETRSDDSTGQTTIRDTAGRTATKKDYIPGCKPETSYLKWKLPPQLGLAMRRASRGCQDFVL